MWGPHEWFYVRDGTPAEICSIANAFIPCVLYDDKGPWWPEEVPYHLKALGSYTIPPCAFYVLLYDVNDTPFLRLCTMDLSVINRVMYVLGFPPVTRLMPCYKVNKS